MKLKDQHRRNTPKYVAMAIFLVAVLVLPNALALKDCQGTMKSSDIPCMIITTWDYPNACNTYEIRFYNSTPELIGTNVLDNYPVADRCNITFNFTQEGTYIYNITSGDSGRMFITEDVDSRYYFYVVVFIAFFSLLGLGYYLKDTTFVILSGMLSVVTAISIVMNGFPLLTNEFLRISIVIVLAGLGFYLILAPTITYMEENFK